MDYSPSRNDKNKYLKYKQKYLELKNMNNQIGGRKKMKK